MQKTKTLNLADIIKLKKDLLWGKYYYALFEDDKLVDSIIFFNPYSNKKVIEIQNIEKHNQGFLQEFTREYAKKKKIHYFIRELDEAIEVSDIEFMQASGFIRYNRNYCFEYKAESLNINGNKGPHIFCRPADIEDLDQLVELDINSQIIEYRDHLYKERRYFKNNIENIYVFADPSKLKNIQAYAFKKIPESGTMFELVIHPRHNDILFPCIHAFAEEFILFEKHADHFHFIISENQKEMLERLQKEFQMLWSSQLLLLEGHPRSKTKQVIGEFAINQAAAGAN